ncbi:MAG: PAS domain S-box protein [Thermodesulfobacteriota bacterium]
MALKPTYEELKQRVRELEKEAVERKRAEEALRRSEQRFKDLIETTTDWVWEVDARGVYTYASPKVKDLLGYEVSEVLGKTPFDLMPEGEAKRIRKFFNEKVINRKPFYGLENVNRHKNGHLVVLETNGIPIFDEKGQLKGYRGIDRDITQRKRAEEALRKSENESKVQTQHLKEVNTALRVLLKQREEDKKEFEEKTLYNVKNLIMPYIEELKKRQLNTDQMTCVSILESNINDLFSPFITRLSSKFLNLTPMEVRVASLIKDGKTTKEIAGLLHLSENTILSHRYKLRSKLRLKNKKLNLISYLQSID